MAIGDDFSITGLDIRYTGDAHGGASPGYYTVIEFHRWIQDLLDDASSTGDDQLDITDSTASERSTDNIISLNNGYNIDDTAAEHLYGGSISQAGGDTLYSGLVVVGSVPSGNELQIVQNNGILTSYWGTGLNTDPAANILLQIMVKTRDASADIDGKRLRVQSRELGDTYAEFSLTAGLGNSTAAIFTQTDLNNQTAGGTIGGWTITNTEGYQGIDVNGDSVDEFYYSNWDPGVQSINDLYEYSKYIQRRGTSETLYGLSGDLFRGITHQISFTGQTADLQEAETVTFSGGSTAQILALDDQGATGTIWVQLLTGSVPVAAETLTGGTSSGDGTVGTVTARTVPASFIGLSTGTSIIGGYGIGIETSVLSASDQLFDLTNTLYTPPNNVVFNVDGLVAGEDYVLVAPSNGGGIDTTQLSVSGALSAGATSVVVASPIPTDTPSSGTIRLFNGSGYDRITYSSYTGSTFTVSAIPNAIADAAGGFVSYLDLVASGPRESFTYVYLSDRPLFVRVRDGGLTPIKTFETTATLGSVVGSATVIRTSDE